MANKRIYYYSIQIKEVVGNGDVTANIRNLFDNVFNTHCVRNNAIRTMSLGRGEDQASLDIIFEDNNYLFARVGKAKNPSDALIRDNATKGYNPVLSGADLINKTLEICTYFLLDYNRGIVGFILGKSAPSVHSLIYIINEYDDDHAMTITSISGPESVRVLQNPGSVLGKIKYTIRTPDVTVLRHLGLTRMQIAALGNSQVQELELTIKNTTRKNLSSDRDVISGIVDAFAALPQEIKKRTSMIGRAQNTSTQTYAFNEQDIVYSVDIPEDVNEDGTRRRYTADELAEEILTRMRNIYREHANDIAMFAGIND